MKETSRANRILAISSVVTSALIGISVFLAFQAMNREFRWNRNVEAFHLLKDFNRDAVGNAQQVMEDFPYHKSNIVMDCRQADSIYHADPEEDSAAYDLRNRIIKLLNYLKAVSTAYQLDVVDRNMVRREFRALFYRVGECFDTFMLETHTGYGVRKGPYDIIREVLKEWRYLDSCETISQARLCNGQRLIAGTWLSVQEVVLSISSWGTFQISTKDNEEIAYGTIKDLFCVAPLLMSVETWAMLLELNLDGGQWVFPARIIRSGHNSSLTILIGSEASTCPLRDWFQLTENGTLTLTKLK